MVIIRCRFAVAAVFCTPAFLPLAWGQSAASYVPVTPCRAVDTRNAAGGLGGPIMTGGSIRSFPIPSSPCGIPANASAYSFNLAVVPSGPLGFVTIWPTGESQPVASNISSYNGEILSNAVLVGVGTSGAVSVYVSNTTHVVLDISGYFVAQNSSTSTAVGTGASNAGTQNTGVGFDALAVNSGNGNTATGSYALAANGSGNNNVAVGASALLQNASGSANTAVGEQALSNDMTASDNTGIGFSALLSDTIGANNTALGVSALYSNGSGSNNTAVGMNALYMSTGTSNVALGYEAGYLATSGSDNIFIANQGQSGDSDVIRIGTAGTQTSTYIAGIAGTNVSGTAVIVTGSGQLGIVSSSRRFKEDIQNMGAASEALMQLRPVTFRYKQALEDGTKPLEYGLIGEEVAHVYPELVIYDGNGQVGSLKYHELPVLLLNELQKQHKRIEELEARIAALEAELRQQSHK